MTEANQWKDRSSDERHNLNSSELGEPTKNLSLLEVLAGGRMAPAVAQASGDALPLFYISSPGNEPAKPNPAQPSDRSDRERKIRSVGAVENHRSWTDSKQPNLEQITYPQSKLGSKPGVHISQIVHKLLKEKYQVELDVKSGRLTQRGLEHVARDAKIDPDHLGYDRKGQLVYCGPGIDAVRHKIGVSFERGAGAEPGAPWRPATKFSGNSSDVIHSLYPLDQDRLSEEGITKLHSDLKTAGLNIRRTDIFYDNKGQLCLFGEHGGKTTLEFNSGDRVTADAITGQPALSRVYDLVRPIGQSIAMRTMNEVLKMSPEGYLEVKEAGILQNRVLSVMQVVQKRLSSNPQWTAADAERFAAQIKGYQSGDAARMKEVHDFLGITDESIETNEPNKPESKIKNTGGEFGIENIEKQIGDRVFPRNDRSTGSAESSFRAGGASSTDLKHCPEQFVELAGALRTTLEQWGISPSEASALERDLISPDKNTRIKAKASVDKLISESNEKFATTLKSLFSKASPAALLISLGLGLAER